MKKLTAILISAVLICSAAACSSGQDAASTAEEAALPSAGSNVAEIDVKDLPSKLDLRNYNGQNYVTAVKNQKAGDCWTFSLSGAAEIACLFANNQGVPTGKPNPNVDFSEKYIAWYLYHGITEDDVCKGRVRASQVGEGFDPAEAEKENPEAVYAFGGEFVSFANLFGSGFGPVSESTEINGMEPFRYGPVTKLEWTLPLNADYRCAPTDAFLRNSCILPSPADTDENGSYVFNEDALNAIKMELYKGHGVSIAFNAADSVYHVKNHTTYYSGDAPADHAVVVVGYDDDFSKDNFTAKSKENSTPPGDGALIIKNSWGMTGDQSPDDGYLYLSYYDHSLCAPMSVEFDSVDRLSHTAFSIDQYDLMMTSWYGITDYETETKTANVFDAEEDESLYQISYVTSLPDTEVSYEIFKGVEKDDPSSGELLEQGVNTHPYGGSHKIDLRDEYPLKKGDRYAVVLTMKRTDAEKQVYTEIFPYATEFSHGLTVRGVINPGESYRFTDGKWSDMTQLKDSLTEKAFEQCSQKYADRKTSTEIKLDSKDTFTVDNYPIKAILAPAG